jgi:hypothetical protein
VRKESSSLRRVSDSCYRRYESKPVEGYPYGIDEDYVQRERRVFVRDEQEVT